MRRRGALVPGLLIVVFALTAPDGADAGGWEVGENTALATARGGTGAVTRRDPSALYFNPSLLPYVDGFQFHSDLNLIDMRLDFRRDDLVYQTSTGDEVRKEFDTVSNAAGPFPVPFLAASYDFGLEDLTFGLAVFGPHSYGRRCMTEIVDGECVLDRENPARHMVVDTDLIQIYAMLGAGYRFRLATGDLNIGLAAGITYQDLSTSLVVDKAGTKGITPPYREDPDNQAYFRIEHLRSWEPTGIAGVSYRSLSGVTVGASYRPPISWESTGTLDVDFPESVSQLGIELTDDEVVLRTRQAHSFRAGIAYQSGEHPGPIDAPRYEVEANLVWENWGIVDHFESDPEGALAIPGVIESELASVFQPKDYQDTFAIRLGGTFAALKWLSFHLGGFIETAAQRNAVTNVDFVSWERYAGSLGNTIHISDWLDLDVGYTYVHSPDREVTNGQVYQQIPLSSCTGPDYTDETCPAPGQPPGTPQNNGTWSSSFQLFGAGLTVKLD